MATEDLLNNLIVEVRNAANYLRTYQEDWQQVKIRYNNYIDKISDETFQGRHGGITKAMFEDGYQTLDAVWPTVDAELTTARQSKLDDIRAAR